jgi:hypothetical protein
LNHRPLAPHASALAKLRHAPINIRIVGPSARPDKCFFAEIVPGGVYGRLAAGRIQGPLTSQGPAPLKPHRQTSWQRPASLGWDGQIIWGTPPGHVPFRRCAAGVCRFGPPAWLGLSPLRLHGCARRGTLRRGLQSDKLLLAPRRQKRTDSGRIRLLPAARVRRKERKNSGHYPEMTAPARPSAVRRRLCSYVAAGAGMALPCLSS